MKKLIYYATLCGLGILHSSSAPSPVANPKSGAPNITVRVESVPDAFAWVDSTLAQKYALPPPAPVVESPPVKVIVDFTAMAVHPDGDAQFNMLYEKTISFIKKHEGYAGGKAYYCVAGYKTIGYGHVVRANEVFPDKISRTQAERLLRRDFNKSIKSALEYSPHLTGSRLLAVAHFIFAKGAGNYSRSTLRKIIDQGGDPSQEFLRWCKYHRPDGSIVKSSYSRKIREWEVDMYNGGKPVHHSPDIPEPCPDIDTTQQLIDTIPANYISEI